MISVILPTCSRARHLAFTLASFRRQTELSYELVVVDDGGDDETARTVQRFERELPIVYIRRSRAGRAASRNAGLAAAQGEVIVFSDDDRLLSPSFLEAHLRALGAPEARRVVLGFMRGIWTMCEPHTGAALYRILAKRFGLPRADARGHAALCTETDIVDDWDDTVDALAMEEGDFQHKVAPAIALYGPSLAGCHLSWFLGSTGNMSAYRGAIEAVGGFDERFIGYGMEDTDLCYRLDRSGARLVIEEAALSYHQQHGRGNVGRELHANIARFARKFPTDLAVALFVSWAAGGVDFAMANELYDKLRNDHVAASTVARSILGPYCRTN